MQESCSSSPKLIHLLPTPSLRLTCAEQKGEEGEGDRCHPLSKKDTPRRWNGKGDGVGRDKVHLIK